MRDSILSNQHTNTVYGSKGEDSFPGNRRIGSKIFQSRESMPENILGKPLGPDNSMVHPISSKNQSKISIKDFLNIKLCEGAVLTVQTPGGTKATIMPINQQHRKNGSNQYSSLFLEKVQTANEEKKHNTLSPYQQQSSSHMNPVTGDSPSLR